MMKKQYNGYILYGVIFFCLLLTQILFYYLIGGEDRPRGLKWLFLSSSLLIALPSLFCKKWPVLLLFFLFDLVLYINILYFRSYQSMIPVDSFHIKLNDLLSLISSGLYSMRSIDLLFSLPFFIAIAAACRLNDPSRQMQRAATANLLLFALTAALIILPHKEIVKDDFINRFRWDRQMGTLGFGYAGYIIYSLWDYKKDYQLSENEIIKIKDFINGNTGETPDDPAIPRKNILIVIVESLESFVIGQTIEDHEITPTLNSLVKDSTSFYIPHVITQINEGMSSDGQLIINTGLLPTSTGAACYLKNRIYPSLSKILQENGYRQSVTLLGHSPTIWNQAELSRMLGYNRLYSALDFDNSDSFTMGISDSSLIAQSIPVIASLPKPFMVQIITISSHNPFTLPDSKQTFRISKHYHPDAARYMESINYADKALGQLVDGLEQKGLLENSILIITGDHYAFPPYFRNKIRQNQPTSELINENGYLPLIIYNSDYSGRYEATVGQIDIFSTLLDVLHLNTAWHGLGNSVFSTTPPVGAISANKKITGDSTGLTNRQREAWTVSDLIIKGNYFQMKQ